MVDLTSNASGDDDVAHLQAPRRTRRTSGVHKCGVG